MPEQLHVCAACKRNTIKLYRIYGNFLRDEEIYCTAHAPAGWIQRQILVPLIEDAGGMVWGYTSAPDAAITRWNALPEG